MRKTAVGRTTQDELRQTKELKTVNLLGLTIVPTRDVSQYTVAGKHNYYENTQTGGKKRQH